MKEAQSKREEIASKRKEDDKMGEEATVMEQSYKETVQKLETRMKENQAHLESLVSN